MEVEHVKANSLKKKKQQMSFFENLVTGGKEKADELAQKGATSDGGNLALITASVVQQEREIVNAALQYASSFHCLVESRRDCEDLKAKPKEMLIFVDKKEGSDNAQNGEVRTSR